MCFQKFKIILASFIGFSLVAGVWDIYGVGAEPGNPQAPAVDYLITSLPQQLTLAPDQVIGVSVTLKNVSGVSWETDLLRLGTIFAHGAKDRPSAWAKDGEQLLPGWESVTRILPGQADAAVSGQTIQFDFQIKAPARTGMYQETFQPVLDGVRWLGGDPVALVIQVGKLVTIAGESTEPIKQMVIHLDTQEGDLVENGVVVATLLVSSGKSGYRTPKGKYTIMNHIENAFSAEYELWMPNWMGLKNDRGQFLGYGFHGLPYWVVRRGNKVDGTIYPGGRLYMAGRLYEGYEHLGKAVSHGCVRFGVHESGVLYDWASNGTPVSIV
ncbi:MAG: L,D-transpeptidase [bacterium]